MLLDLPLVHTVATSIADAATAVGGLGSVQPAPGQLDPVPTDTEVKAGWTALLIWLGMALAVVLLAISLVRHLRKTKLHFDAADGADAAGAAPDAPAEARGDRGQSD